MENGHLDARRPKGIQESQLSKLVTIKETGLLCPIRYLYNYLPNHIKWLKTQPISLNRRFLESKARKPGLMLHRAEGGNSICLNPRAAMLPVHTGLKDFRQNKYWQATEKATREFLMLFAQDRRCSEVLLRDRRSMSDLAQEQLAAGVLDTYSRFCIYMFAEADEHRIQLLAECIVLIFIFDGEPKAGADCKPEMTINAALERRRQADNA